jgi:hypothetical protein
MSTISPNLPASLLGGYLSVPDIAVPQTKDPGLAQIAANLSEEAGILSTLGGGSTIPQASDPAGLMSWIEQPYNSSSSPDALLAAGDPAASAQDSVDQQILDGFSSDPLLSATYNAAGALQTPASNPSSNWATVIHDNPGLSDTMAADTVDLSIIRQLSTYA